MHDAAISENVVNLSEQQPVTSNILIDSFADWQVRNGNWENANNIARSKVEDKEAIMLSYEEVKSGDFIYEIEAKWVEGGGGYGVIFGANEKGMKGFFYNGKQGILYFSKCKSVAIKKCRDHIVNPKQYKTDTDWHTIKVELIDMLASVFIDGKNVFRSRDKISSTGRIGILSYSKTQAVFRNPLLKGVMGKDGRLPEIVDMGVEEVSNTETKKKGAISKFFGAIADSVENTANNYDNEYTREYKRKQQEEAQAKTFDPSAEPKLASSTSAPPDYGILKSLIAGNILRDVPSTWVPFFNAENVTIEGVQLLRIGVFKGEYWPVEARIRGTSEFFGDANQRIKNPNDIKTFDKRAQFRIWQDDFGDWLIKRTAE